MPTPVKKEHYHMTIAANRDRIERTAAREPDS